MSLAQLMPLLLSSFICQTHTPLLPMCNYHSKQYPAHSSQVMNLFSTPLDLLHPEKRKGWQDLVCHT